MKKIIYTVVTCISALFLGGCADTINIFPVENNTADQFYKTEFELKQAVMGIYARLGRNRTNTDFPTDFYLQCSEGRSDNWYSANIPNAQRDQCDLRYFQVTDATSLNETNYSRLYQIIKEANNLLVKATADYSRFRAEASFLRALAYFELVRAYGPQPIITTPITNEEAKHLSRQPITEVYAQIISDLEFAMNTLADFYTGEDAGRVGAVAARCLLGQVYITMAGYPLNDQTAYEKAEAVLSSIMDKVKTRLAPNYADIFDVNKENCYDLFSIQFASGGQNIGSSMAGYVTTSSGSSTCFPEWAYAGYSQQGQDFRVDSLLIKQMRVVGDLRLETCVASGYWNTVKHGYTANDSAKYYVERDILIKYLTKDNTNSTIKSWNDYPLNYPVLRVADAYLLYAEALVKNNKASQAKEWINVIRKRAGLTPLNTDPTIDDIMYERRCEFLGEGKRYFDLVRMGEATFVGTLKGFSNQYEHVTVLGANNPDKRDMLLPIPRTVRNIHTSWDQNYGY
ncbi:RagB/SusD family nutrient uptake outer membrane protein [Bacteroides graminisolvens]